jgi:integrase
MHLIFQQYDERLNRRRAKPHTLRNYRRTVTLFEESGLDPLTAEDWQIEEWLAGLPVAPRTKRLHAENLSATYNYALQRRVLTQSPMDAVKLPREPDKEPRILEVDELRTLIQAAITDQEWLMVHLLIYTGMRRNEVRTLRWEDVSATSLRVIGKGDKLRHVPLHPRLQEVLVEARHKGSAVIAGPHGEPLSETGIWNRLERVRGEIDCSFHDFRRTVATSLAENDVPERIIDGIMGWAPRTVGRRYYIRRADHRMQEAILRLYADNPL